MLAARRSVTDDFDRRPRSSFGRSLGLLVGSMVAHRIEMASLHAIAMPRDWEFRDDAKRNRYATFIGTDTDLTCVHMTALNMLVRNANAVIVHGNTLSLECFGGYVTRSTALGGVMQPLSAEAACNVLVSTVRAAAPAPQIDTVTPEAPQQEPQAVRVFGADKKGQFEFDF